VQRVLVHVCAASPEREESIIHGFNTLPPRGLVRSRLEERKRSARNRVVRRRRHRLHRIRHSRAHTSNTSRWHLWGHRPVPARTATCNQGQAARAGAGVRPHAVPDAGAHAHQDSPGGPPGLSRRAGARRNFRNRRANACIYSLAHGTRRSARHARPRAAPVAQ
jgi:hypothetical protein